MAIGWDRGPFSLLGTLVAVIGLLALFGSYWLNRKSDHAGIDALLLKLFLGVGCLFFAAGLIQTLFWNDPSFPVGYLFAVGSVCMISLSAFHAYTKRRLR